ncbi:MULTISPECIES: hypothetical protein [Paraburkholderia]|jgi:hypothetical protein|uniref:Uncharacterized protein n=1 Tax=Paraburkholderia phenazinium TaxID=60549 RepID=A0A1N6F610_9BURK|nr:hypothetical protein [Paraburkholderia phenazinium]SIN90701.1 hypothetical protein SAMN05444165_0016 [Paraburkholderia phenazinium]
MTPERFRTIVDAYGADPRRWPDKERAAAEAWADLHRVEANGLLAESAGLDAWLASHTVAAPERAFVERIVAAAPARRPVKHRGRLWWQGAAFAGIGLAGGLAGAFAVSFFVLTGTPPQGHESSSYMTSSFDGSTADWSGE